MKKLLILICLAISVVAFAGPEDVKVSEANTLYNDGMFNEALGKYLEVVDAGFESSELYYNIGNAYFKLGELPNAILFYERAKKLDPSNEDIQYNLGLANSRIIDKHEQVPDIILKQWWNSFYNLFSVNTWAKVAIGLFIASLVFFAVYLLSHTRIIKKLFFFVFVFIFLGTAFSFALAFQKYYYSNEHKEAIVFEPTITVKSNPSKSSVDLFVIHEGTKLYITDELEDWVEIRIANGSVGWLPKTAMVKI